VERVRVVAAVLAALLLLQIVRSVRREHIRVEYSMAWFAAAVLLLGLSLSDTALGWLSRALGIEDASLVLLGVAGVLFVFTFFRFTVVVSGLKDHNIVLAQKVGMLEWEIKRQASELKRLREERARGAGGSPGTEA
jgi:hypothetical protein